MKHLGDITKINGAEIEPVDVITGGSPCQDLSVAGKRAGLAGARSGLFMEQIRIIKEMRDADKLRIERLSDTKIRGRSGTDNTIGKGGGCGDIRNTNAVSTDCGKGGTADIAERIAQHGLCGAGQLIRPRYMVWENVPGAFSSNKGEDFRAVLEEICRVADSNADVPQPPNGKWSNAGCIMGNGWSIAWRVHDAQFWGVPQRRRRISLVADFGGCTAPEILFERKGVSWDSAESGAQGERVAGDVESGVDSASGVKCLNPSFPQSARIYDSSGVWHSLNANENGGQSRDAVLYEPKSAFEENWAEAGKGTAGDVETSVAYAVRMREGCEGGGKGPLIQTEKSGTLGTGNDQTIFSAGFCQGASPCAKTIGYQEEVSPTIKGAPSGTAQVPAVFSFDSLASNSMKSSNPHSGCREVEISKTLDCFDPNPSKNQGGIAILQQPTYCIQGNCIDRADTARCNGKVFENHGQDTRFNGPVDVSQTVSATFGMGGNNTPFVVGNGQANQSIGEVVGALNCMHDQMAVMIAAVDCRNGTENPDVNGTLQAKEQGQNLNSNNVVRSNMTVRRLTPLECERLQGYPDGWTLIGEPETRKVEIKDEDTGEVIDTVDETVMTYMGSDGKKKKCSDSARYKALGNSIALPFWFWMLKRMSAYLPEGATLGSLFDGIGGFPLCWELIQGKGTARWASEIEEFPIAVTKLKFKEESI